MRASARCATSAITPRAAAFSISIPPGAAAPIRLDFFGDTLESIRAFDPETQRSVGQLRALDLAPMSEARLTTETIRRFRQAYVAEFGAPRRGDALYEAVSEGRRAIGLEHWLPLFYERMDTLFDYVGGAPFVLDARAEEAASARFAQIADYYAARRAALPGGSGQRRLSAAAARAALSDPRRIRRAARRRPLARLTPFEAPPGARDMIDCGGRVGRDFAPERLDENVNVFDAAVRHIGAARAGPQGGRRRLERRLARAARATCSPNTG